LLSALETNTVSYGKHPSNRDRLGQLKAHDCKMLAGGLEEYGAASRAHVVGLRELAPWDTARQAQDYLWVRRLPPPLKLHGDCGREPE